ncbi:SO_0444 family Cu/Zn efflux transporter [Cognaticolwellia mytili]|uniref:SO_0444 family Cu/Zn efflux transporter n=1 Tax=Cognaticolwellia mytili TaxID=1888913 RepID=UPI001F3242BC|nr:SO_0444 family Cu/Zn efflux transporter [Cognaticolwellia mytili]
MSTFILFFDNLLQLSAEASPWLILGLLIAGLMKAWVPSKILSRHLGHGKRAIIKAALIGAPLPLCSCGVIPVATELRRSGASAPATSAFLVATPETGVDSVSVSYALLGPLLAIYRPITAILSAIFTGMLVATSKVEEKSPANETKTTSCCASENVKAKKVSLPGESDSSCCASKVEKKSDTVIEKTLIGIRYSATQLIDDLIRWLLIGLLFATIVRTFVPASFLLSYGSGLAAMLVMIAMSIPMYICATASTPIAAGFILAGISPGTALVFMMAGPATNISTLGVIKNEMGTDVLVKYLLGIAISAITFGLLLDWGLNYFMIDISQQMQHSHELLPYWFGLTCTGLLVFLSIKPLRKRFI